MILRTVKDFAALARDRRRALGWSQQQLADQLGVNRDWITNFEHGKSTVQFGLVLRALRVLGVTLDVPITPVSVDYSAAGTSQSPSKVQEVSPHGSYDIDIVNLDDVLNAPPGDPPVFSRPKPHS